MVVNLKDARLPLPFSRGMPPSHLSVSLLCPDGRVTPFPGRTLEMTPERLSDAEALFKGRSIEGLRATLRLTFSPLTEESLEVSVHTQISGGGGRAPVHQLLELLLPAANDVKLVLPGIWLDGNPYTAKGAPSRREATDWSFRDDRLAWPAVIAFSPSLERVWVLLRSRPASVDRGPLQPMPSLRQGVICAPEDSDMGAMGFMTSEATTRLRAHLPFAELPFSYFDKRSLSPQTLACYAVDSEASFSVHYRICQASAHSIYDALEVAGREALSCFGLEGTFAGDRSLFQIRQALVQGTSSFAFDRLTRRGVRGTYTFVKTFGGGPVIPICEPAFTGRAFAHAVHQIRFSQLTGLHEGEARASSMLDDWLPRALVRGLVPDFRIRSLGGIPLERPFTFDPPVVRPDNPSVSTRRVAEVTSALLEACQLRSDRQSWLEAAWGHLEALHQFQQPDGGFARRYRFSDRQPVGPFTVGPTPSTIAPLLQGWRMTGEPRFRQAALRAGDFIRHAMLDPFRFHGSTLDADCEDKEAATEALSGLRQLYLLTGEERFLEDAAKVGWLVLTWICLTDIPFAADTLLSQWKVRTTGLSLVSTENNHADTYLFSLAADLFWLGDRLGIPMFKTLAWAQLKASLQLLPTAQYRLQGTLPDGVRRTVPTGLIPEVLNQTSWVYLEKPRPAHRHGKGQVNGRTALWTPASLWYALEALQNTVPEEEFAAHLNP